MYFFPYLDPVCCSMSSSNCCFLTCIQVSQEAGQVVRYAHFFQNFPQFVVIHTVEGFGTVNKTEVDIFLELLLFHDLADVGNLTSGSSDFCKFNLSIWKFVVHILLNPGLENFEHYFASIWDECNCAVVWAFLGIAFLWDWNENWPFPVLWPLLSFPNLLAYIECSIFTASSSRFWNSSTGIPSLPLALFIECFLRLTSLCISGCLALGERSYHHDYLGHEDLFLYSSSVYSCHIFLITSASVRSVLFLIFIVPVFAWNVPLISLIFLKRSLVFPIILFSSISLHWSLRKAFLFLFAVLWNSAFKWIYLSFSPLPFASLLFTAICNASSDNHFAFCISFSWGWFDHCLLYNVMNLHP